MDVYSLQRQSKQPNWWHWLPLILWAAIIFFTSHQPRAAIPHIDPGQDYQPGWIDQWLGEHGLDRDALLKKTAHAVGFGIFGLLALFAAGNAHTAFWLTLLYAVLDEWHQGFIPTRTSHVFDVLIDGGGAGIFLLVRYVWYKTTTFRAE